MKTRTFLLSLLAAPATFAAPFQPETIPAEAAWYLHSDFGGLRETITGKTMMKEFRKEQSNMIDQVEEIFGFNILTDLTDVTLFGSGEADEAAVMLSGKLDRDHLEEVIVHADSYLTSAHGETTIHHWNDEGKDQHAAFHGDQTLIISEHRKLVIQALDVLAKKRSSVKLDQPLPSPAPVIVAFANLKNIDLPVEKGSRIIRKAESLFVTLGEKDERLSAAMTVKTNSEKTARQMMHVIQGAVSLGELAEEEIDDLDMKHRAKVEGKTMSMSMTLSAAKALVLLSELN